ncbi:hypothetical protein AgCh_027612 [Apium graveolens]
MWIEKAGPLATFGDNSKGLSEGYGCLQAGYVISEILYIVLGTCCTLHLELDSSKMCTSVLLVGESKEEVSAPQFMDFAAADLLDYVISSSQSHFRSDSIVQGSLVDQLPLQVLGEDTDPKAICQWLVSTSPGLNPLDAFADSGSDIDSSDEFNKDGDLRTPIAPPVTSLRMAKVIFLAGTADFWSYERSDTLVRMSVNTSGEKSETHKIFRRMVAAQGRRYEFGELVYRSVVTTAEKAYIEVTFKARRSGETGIHSHLKQQLTLPRKV